MINALLISSDPVIDQFVRDHLLLVGGAAFTIFTAGCAVGRFLFDRLVATLRAEAEEFKNQRDEARRQLQEARLQVEQGDKGNDLQVKAKTEASRAQATGRLFSAIATILLLTIVGYNLYLQSLLSNALAAESARTADFQQRTEAAIKALQPKPPSSTAPKAPAKPKPQTNKPVEKRDAS